MSNKPSQIELAKQLGVSKAYISMVLSGRKKPSKQIATKLKRMGMEVNFQVNFEANNSILSHARLPIPTLPHECILNNTKKHYTIC